MEKSTTDILWVLISAGLVFTMQAGFMCLEAGVTRRKNNINVAMKNLSDFGVSTLVYWLFGYAFMFGRSRGGWLGLSDFAPDLGYDQVWLSAYVFSPILLLYPLWLWGPLAVCLRVISGDVLRHGSYHPGRRCGRANALCYLPNVNGINRWNYLSRFWTLGLEWRWQRRCYRLVRFVGVCGFRWFKCGAQFWRLDIAGDLDRVRAAGGAFRPGWDAA